MKANWSVDQRTSSSENRERFYWQEFVEGLPCSGIYVGDGVTAQFLGATQQLIGDRPAPLAC